MSAKKITLNELRNLVKQILKEEELKKNETYMCALPMDSTEKHRIYVKVKFIGTDNDGGLIVSPLEEVRYMVDGKTNSFASGKQYNTSMEFMLGEDFASLN